MEIELGFVHICLPQQTKATVAPCPPPSPSPSPPPDLHPGKADGAQRPHGATAASPASGGRPPALLLLLVPLRPSTMGIRTSRGNELAGTTLGRRNPIAGNPGDLGRWRHPSTTGSPSPPRPTPQARELPGARRGGKGKGEGTRCLYLPSHPVKTEPLISRKKDVNAILYLFNSLML